jgi:uncharacterized RDD family membrane protein YckC
MNTINIQTAQNIEIAYDIASVGERIAGSIIDFVIKGAYILLGFLLFTLHPAIDYLRILLILFLMPVLFYDLVMEQFLNGQSPGKRLMKIRVISIDGNRPSFGQYLLRWLFRLIDFAMSEGLVALVCVAASNKRQRVGDMVAQTTLIKTIPRSSLQHTIYAATDESYQVRYPEVTQLSDHDIQLLKETITLRNKTDNISIVYQAADKVKSVLHITSTQEPLAFLQQVILDYNHLTGNERM